MKQISRRSRDACEKLEVKRHMAALSTPQQQQLVYASLMRFGSETISLRHRCLDHLVMNGLLGTSREAPLKIGELQNKLHGGTYSPVFRPEVLRETLLRLEKEKKVDSVVLKKKKAYFLTPSGIELVGNAIVTAERLYKPVLDRLLKHTDHLISEDVGVSICTSFLCEAFTQCGLGIAKNVQGDIAGFPHYGDLSAAFDAALKGLSISDEAKETLHTRCLALFKSRDLDDRRLIFYLTQGYYFAQLLGLDHRTFDPVAEQAFAGAVFYLDTNVLLPGFLRGDEGGRAFVEMINVAKRIGITLKITRASINEARRVAADRLTELKQIQSKVPAELAERSLDDFITHFYEESSLNPALTPEKYLEPFDRLTDTVREWGVEIDDLVEAEMLEGNSFSQLENCIQQRAAQYRKGRVKSQNVLRHDVAHYALITAKREHNPKTWFLTRDKSLMSAGEAICGNGAPFCFGLIGFLQSISPYVLSDCEGNSLSIVFSDILREQLITTDRLFDSRELVLLAQMHSDVLATAKENLIPAIDFVKATVLKGKAYRSEDVPAVSLELRKFLACSTDEQKRVLEVLNAQLESEAKAEREAAAKSRRAQEEAERALLASQQDVDARTERLQSAIHENTSLRTRLETEQSRTRLILAFLGSIAGLFLWYFRLPVATAITNKLGARQTVDDILYATASFLFCFPAFHFLRKVRWNEQVKLGLGAVILSGAIWATKAISPSAAADVASYLTIGVTVVGVLVFGRKSSL